MRKILVVTVAAVALMVAGWQHSGVAHGVAAKHTLTSGGVERSYLLTAAAKLQNAPLVVVLHGGYGSARQAQQSYGWDGVARRSGVAVVYPDGLNRSWNAGSCCGQGNANDVAFIQQVVTDVRSKVSIDPARIYVTGMSNGAMMALRMACDTNIFAAVAPVAGTLLTPCSHPSPSSLLQIHGKKDDRVPFNGGPGKVKVDGAARVDGPSIPEIDRRWRELDVCAPPLATRAGTVEKSVATCLNGRSVQLIALRNGGHDWPRVPINATNTIWDFFATQSK